VKSTPGPDCAVEKLAERLYVEAMRNGSRERLQLPVDAWFWEERARRLIAAEHKS
jgi:hypothetical protein